MDGEPKELWRTSRKRLSSELVLHIVDASSALPFAPAIADLSLACFGAEDVDVASQLSDARARGAASVLESIIGYHALEDCIFLLVEHSLPTLDAAAQAPALVALAVCTAYARALHVANLGTDPRARNRGIASLLLYECHDLAYELLLPALCGTVQSESAHLHAYYSRLGAKLDATNALGSGGVRSLRFTRPVHPLEVGTAGVRARTPPRTSSRKRAPLAVALSSQPQPFKAACETASTTWMASAQGGIDWLGGQCAGTGETRAAMLATMGGLALGALALLLSAAASRSQTGRSL
jgi:GNAT superfamily N-acetyltransferase